MEKDDTPRDVFAEGLERLVEAITSPEAAAVQLDFTVRVPATLIVDLAKTDPTTVFVVPRDSLTADAANMALGKLRGAEGVTAFLAAIWWSMKEQTKEIVEEAEQSAEGVQPTQ